MTCAHTIEVASGSTGLTLPGMMLDPGCRSGRRISPRPARGPDPIQRRSVHVLCRPTAIVRSWPLVSTRASRLPCASKWSRASVSGSSVSSARTPITFSGKPGGVLMPVPTAVPPNGSSASRGNDDSSRSMPRRSCAAYPPNSWPSVTGVASIRWVRPDFTTPANSSALASNAAARWSSAGMRSRLTASVAATWIEVGNVSLLDWLALTWSLGWTSRPSARVARVAMTSLAFMLLDVPEPVWNTSIGNSPSCCPSATARAACSMACATSASMTPSSALTLAAAALIRARAWMCAGSSVVPEIGKFSTARCVCARHSASRGTRTSPIVSCSIRYASSLMPPPYDRPTTPPVEPQVVAR